MVIPPVDRNLLPAADRKALLQDGAAQGRRKALRLHATYHAQKSACARCSPSPCPLRAWEVAIEPQPDRSIAPSTHAAAAAVAKGRLVGRSSPELLPAEERKPVIEAAARATGRGADSSVGPGAPRQRPARHETRRRPGADPAPCAPRACARPPARPSSRSSPPTQKKQRTVAGPQRQNGTMNRRVTPRQAAN